MNLISVLFLITLITAASTNSCHYSCATCTGPAYTQCLSCSDSSLGVSNSVTCDGNDQSILGQKGGYCGSGAYSRANPLGIIVILIAIVAGTFLKSQYVFSFMLSLQTIGLIGLVEAAFPYGLSILLGSCDYFMLFSIMGQNKKPQNCKLMLRNMYRLNDFLGTTSFQDNSLPILIIIFIVTALLVAVTLFRAFRKET